MTESERPLPVRVLRLAGWAMLGFAAVAFGIGAILKFDELAKIWAAIGGILLVTAALAFLGSRPTIGGMTAAMVACTLLLLFPPVGTIITIVIAVIASQSWPQLREYYGLRRRAA
ncbi:MAG: hypothetical protein WEB06_04895 [Actinomycetota bacterium]